MAPSSDDMNSRLERMEQQLHWQSSRRRRRFRSALTVMGLPLLSVAIGPDFEENEIRGHAFGIIAVGDIATGCFALGGIAQGIVAVGGIATGVLSVGGCALGILAALGGVAVGGFALGGVAIGWKAIGGVSVTPALIKETLSSIHL